MILSFHPCITADKNIICAGRQPDANDRSAIQSADAVILPQGCRRSLYDLARRRCRHVFPNYDARFAYPGKTDQIRLFRETDTPHPFTLAFSSVDAYLKRCGEARSVPAVEFPFVFKFDWGGEGDTVYLVEAQSTLETVLSRAQEYERTGQAGFLIQEYIPQRMGVLRVVAAYRRLVTYWRVQTDPGSFCINVTAGAGVDKHSHPGFRKQAEKVATRFCDKTGINLAGFDFLVGGDSKPLMLEVNYYFGRRGLGGSKKWYHLLRLEIDRWLNDLGLQ